MIKEEDHAGATKTFQVGDLAVYLSHVSVLNLKAEPSMAKT
ncbi:MAG: hypothetical protein R2860_15835 [Desulfobacterales bacterium]